MRKMLLSFPFKASPLPKAIGVIVAWMVLNVGGVWGQYVVDFEGAGETKGSYASGTVNLSGLDWDLTEVLIGGSESADWKNGARSARLRGYGTSAMTMLEDKSDGVGSISFLYRRYGTDAQVDWKVEYSIDEGVTWTQVGDDFTAPASDEVQTFSETLNIFGNVRFRIKRATQTGTNNRRLNIDDIVITDYKFEVIDFDDNAKWAPGSGGIASYQTDHQYEDQGWVFTGGDALRQITTEVDDFPGALGTYSWRLRDAAGTDWRASFGSRGIIEAIGFDVRRWDDNPNPNWIVQYSTDGGDTFSTVIFTINNDFLDNSSDWKTVYHIFSEPLQVNEGQFVLRFFRNGGERIMVDNFAYKLQHCLSTDSQFRTENGGSWFEASNWEIFDGSDWNGSFCVPDLNASAVQIDHLIEINREAVLANVTINNSGQLSVLTDQLRLTGDQAIVIESGGVMSFDGGDVPVFENGANVTVKNNGIIRVNVAPTQISNRTAGTESSGNFIYEDGSVFEWNSPLAFVTTGAQRYFPDVEEETIPVFRVTTSPSVGAGTTTTINGLFEAVGNITWQNNGDKIFRNGIIGTGNITQLGGTFIIKGETAEIGGTGNLILNNNGLVINSPSAQLVSDKTISGGPIEISGALRGGDHTLSIGGDVNVTSAGSFLRETSTIQLNGSSIQTLSGMNDFYNLTLSNASGIQTENDISIFNRLTLNSGTITMLNDAILEIGDNPSNRGELILSSSTHGTVNGRVKRWFNNSASGPVLFPLAGVGSNYNPATILFPEATPPSAEGSLTARFIQGYPANEYNGLPFTQDDITFNTISEYGYWEINAGDGLEGGEYTMALDLSGISGIEEDNRDRIRILKRANEDQDWILSGNYVSFATNILTQSGMTGFSDFTIGGNFLENPLPIELLYFKASDHSDHVLLSWATASETNNDYFTLERSADMQQITVIGYKQGAGNSTKTLSYQFIDFHPLDEISYYRLKQTDFDGSFDYSAWVSVMPEAKQSELAIHGIRQHNDRIHLWAEVQKGQPLLLEVFDLYGRMVYTKAFHPAGNLLDYSFAAPADGLLFIRLTDPYATETSKILTRSR